MNKKKYPLVFPVVLLMIFLLYTELQGKDHYYIPFFISFINVIFNGVFLFKNWNNTKWVVRIFILYYCLTLKFPLIYNCLKYDLNTLDKFYGSSLDTLIETNLLIFLFDILFVLFYKLFKFKTKLKWIYNLKPSKIPELFIVIFFFTLSLLAKLYLVKTGVWFFYEMNDLDLTKIPFVSLAFSLEKLDIIILLFYVFKTKSGVLSKKDVVLLTIFLSISMLFAVISTSKGRVLTLFFPLILILFYSNKKRIGFLVVGLSLITLNQFFDYMMYLRMNPGVSIVEGYKNFSSQKVKSSQSIKENKFIYRIEYQSVIAKTIKTYQNDLIDQNDKVPFGYFQNIFGIIPRIIWKDKPQLGLDTNLIGREIKAIRSIDNYTTIGLTPIGSSYYMYGYIGILYLAIFAAALLKYFNTIILEDNWIGFLLTFTIGISIARNGTFVNIIPELLQVVLICLIFGFLLRAKRR